MQTHYTVSRDEIFDVANNASAAIKQACGASGAGLTFGDEANCTNSSYWTSLVGTTLTYDTRNHAEEPDAWLLLPVG